MPCGYGIVLGVCKTVTHVFYHSPPRLHTHLGTHTNVNTYVCTHTDTQRGTCVSTCAIAMIYDIHEEPKQKVHSWDRKEEGKPSGDTSVWRTRSLNELINLVRPLIMGLVVT